MQRVRNILRKIVSICRSIRNVEEAYTLHSFFIVDT